MPFTSQLTKRNPLHFPRDPVPGAVESEAYKLGVDARNDFRPIDENPYSIVLDKRKNADWTRGWSDTDRMLDDESGD